MKSFTRPTATIRAIRSAATILTLGLASFASAGIVEFSGMDNGAGPASLRPNSNAAAAAFDAALAPGFGVITFENVAAGYFALPILVAPGVTLTVANGSASACGGFCDDQATSLGYNTTSGGQRHLRTVPQAGQQDITVTFDFATPISAFGGYFTGTEALVSGFFSITFDDGTAQELSLTEHPGSGGVLFYGFTDAGASISRVTINEIGPFQSTVDIWGLDDVRFGSAAAEPEAVPEPGTLALIGVGVGGLVLRRRSRR